MTLGMSVYYGMLWVLFLVVCRSSHFKFDVARRSAVTSLADNKRSLSVKVLVFEEILNELCEDFDDFFWWEVNIHRDFLFLFFFHVGKVLIVDTGVIYGTARAI